MTRFVIPDPRREGRAVARLTAYFLLVALACWLTAGCATTDPFIASGQSLDAMASAFLTVARAYDAAIDQKIITPAQYNAWKKVGQEIQKDYGPAVAAWNAAVGINDATKITEAKAKVASIVAQLTQFGLVVGVRVADLIQVK
jgi:hypothetical protein